MERFPSDIKFKFNWRKYQQRVLDELKHHLNDNHLHIIAPPGSGKTILGLEVMLRLNKPTLIFAPTIAIRNQWIQRFNEMFIPSGEKPDWISRNIKNPKFITVSTYQGLHAAFSGKNEDELEEPEENDNDGFLKKEHVNSILHQLKKIGIGTIVVDEAHHLKNAWWQSLTELKKELSPTVVGLTATPPYDVTHSEWLRYLALNGPVDAEISVPELIAEGDLCPHQDYIYFSQPSTLESEKIDKYRARIKQLFTEIKLDTKLINAIENHFSFKNPEQNLEWIYTNLEYYSAIIIFLNAIEKQITPNHLKIIGDNKAILPELDYEWMEILLTFYLYKGGDAFNNHFEHQEALVNKLKKFGAIERRSINFRHNRKLSKYLRSSINKLQSIANIVEFEQKELKNDLRLVVLSDYIRKEYLVDSEENKLELNKLGVLSIFEKLRRESKKDLRIGVLTGSIIIIPSSAKNNLTDIANSFGISSVSMKPLPYDSGYLIVESNDKLKHDIVQIVTRVFQNGGIQVLVGTKSLLGEGWDAPSINALILASFVGSYVLSNQMRGRAIRTERANTNKTANIWHLVSIDITSPDSGDDYQLLSRRFNSFVGISTRNEVSIENGMERMDLPIAIDTPQRIEAINQKMFTLAKQRESIQSKWLSAIESGNSLIEEIKIPFPKDKNYRTVKSMYLNKTIANLLASLMAGLLAFGEGILQGLGKSMKHIKTLEDFYMWLSTIGIIGLLFFGRRMFTAFRLYIKYRDIAKDIQGIGEALVKTLTEMKVFAITNHKVVAELDKYGAVYCHLEGGSTYEKSTFISCLHEVIGTVNNPRYVVIRKNKFALFIKQKDYHSVPEIIGKKKKHASYFESQWKSIVGNCELIYTRNIEGRQTILKARIHSLASQFKDNTQRVNKWK